MAVADVFDALVSHRSYKKSFPMEQAMQIIHDGSGTHFDPKVVEAFERARDHAGSGKPSVILAHTVKGKGVSFMENNILWHYRTPQGEEYEAALKELEAQRP